MPIKNKHEFSFWLNGKTIKDVALYNVNENYFMFSPRLVVIDGAVEIKFSDNSHIIIGFNESKQLIDATTESLEEMLGDLDYYEIEHEWNTIHRNLTNKAIANSNVRWTW
ncbi:MAG: hypothetical protein ACK4K0_00155 [Flavobacteriales bacterium]